MRNRRSFSLSRWLSIALIIAAFAVTVFQIIRFSRLRADFPYGMSISGVPVGGLDRQSAAQRLLEAYSYPVELHYNENVIHLDPSVVGFELDLQSMLAAADLERTKQTFWLAFWDFLWGNIPREISIPLRATISESRLRTFLETEVSSRYDQPPSPAVPIAGTVDFSSGDLGTELNIERSLLPIENALRSTNQRIVSLPIQRSLPPRPNFQNLEILLKQTIDLAELDALAGLYLLDLQTANEIHFAYHNGLDYPLNPDVAFSAASIIKIPILVSVYRRLDDNPDVETERLIEKMIIESGNETSDWLMERIIDPARAPLEVTSDLQDLGLENTFLAGHFYQGAPLLSFIDTPSNSREDINTNPDLYNQTTTSDIGALLEDLYQCSETGGGALIAVFPGEINQTECQDMINYLSRDRIANLLEAGIPQGTLAHKHGWITDNGIINLVGDAGIIYTPGGNYILVIFLYHPEQLVWDPTNELVGQLSRAVYNFYNLPD